MARLFYPERWEGGAVRRDGGIPRDLVSGRTPAMWKSPICWNGPRASRRNEICVTTARLNLALACALAALAFGTLLIESFRLTLGQTVAAFGGRGRTGPDRRLENPPAAHRRRLSGLCGPCGGGRQLSGALSQPARVARHPRCLRGSRSGRVRGYFPVALNQLPAFVSGLAAVAVLMDVTSEVRGGDRVLTLVLTGVLIGALSGAARSLLKVLADPCG